MGSGSVWIAGVDEAGLGPQLGPLVVGASLFEIDADLLADHASSAPDGTNPSGHPRPFTTLANAPDLWALSSATVCSDRNDVTGRIVICDSKQLYSTARGIGPLEESLLPLAMAVNGAAPLAGVSRIASFADYWRHVSMIGAEHLAVYPWYRAMELHLPLCANRDKVEIRARKLSSGGLGAGVRLDGLWTLPVLEGEFNRLLRVHKNKADAHCSSIARVLLSLWKRAPDVIVYCDRLGGRKSYAEALRVHLRPDAITMHEETDEHSVYTLERTGANGRETMTLHFTVESDGKHLPAALASMAAKYTRELCMNLFNRYFSALQPGLKPTAGYFGDGKRFLADTAEVRRREGIKSAVLIRRR